MLRLGHILVIIICITFGFKLHANPHTDTVFVYFQRGYSIVDPLYAENQKNLKKLFTDIKNSPPNLPSIILNCICKETPPQMV